MHRVGNGFEPLGSVLFATRLGRDSIKDSYTTIAETAFLQRNIAELQLESQIVESCHVALIGSDTGIAVNQLAQKLQLLPNQKNNLISVSEFQTGYETLLENYAWFDGKEPALKAALIQSGFTYDWYVDFIKATHNLDMIA